MKILSLFDWMSCWQIAINNLWIKDYEYFASEIDKFAIQVTKENYPNTIHIWDVTKVSWYKDIDILLWWSPCQWFSFAWKQLNFDDPRSKLFFEYVRILKEVKPKYFLLENVRMKKEYQDVISAYLFWIQPTIINSSLLTAQNRVRLYWVWELQEDWNYKQVEIEQPEDRKIYLKDIMEMWYYNWEKCIDWLNRIIVKEKVKVRKYPVNIEWLKKCLREHKNITIKEIAEKLNQPKTLVEHWFRNDNCFAIPCEDIWLDLKELLWITTDEFDKSIMEFEIRDWKFDMANRVYKINWKAPTLTTITWWKQKKIIDDTQQIREITLTECERLQWVRDNYTSCVSNSQRYKMLGNWWTIPVIEHILKYIIN